MSRTEGFTNLPAGSPGAKGDGMHNHLVGYVDHGCYEGIEHFREGDECYYPNEVVFFVFCPECGEKLVDPIISLVKPKARNSADMSVPASMVTKEALRLLASKIK
jgi:hypothetical protein